MKFKKIISSLLVFCLMFSMLSSIQVNAQSEPSSIPKIEYMDFVRAIDSAVGEADKGYSIIDPSFIKSYVKENYVSLKDIETFKGFSEKDIYNHVENTIKESNKTYKKTKPSAEFKVQDAVTLAYVTIPAEYHYERAGEYSKDCWWGVSKLFTTTDAMRIYVRDLNVLAASVTISTFMLNILGWPAVFIGYATAGMTSLAFDIQDNSHYYSVLFVDIPLSIMPYDIYAG